MNQTSNALTVDVEDYFHVTAFEKHIKPEDWDKYPLRVMENTARVLDLLEEHYTRATFFVLGWVAERCPWIVKEIQKRNHEIACHSYDHKLIYNMNHRQFRSDIKRSKDLLEDITGQPVWGYRAPSYSIISESLWALDILIEEGFLYDSSIFPVVHDLYGIKGACGIPHKIRRGSGSIVEFPLSTYPINLLRWQYRLPVAGGGYLRLFPLWFTRKAIERLNNGGGHPALIYFHPWEIDVDQPRVKVDLKSRFRHYVNLHTTEKKLRNLLSSFNFQPITDVLQFKAEEEEFNYPMGLTMEGGQ
jgi:polysaccharide deacetylase family protein (PEP-CTERM system associated)